MSRNLHRLAGGLEIARRRALDGPCVIHPDRSAVAYIENVIALGQPKGACEACAAYGEDHGYSVHRPSDGAEGP